MKTGKGQSSYADERYAVQRRFGFPWLRFLPDLEEEYRASYIELNATRIRVSAVIGVFGVLGFIFVDQVMGSNLEPARGDWLLLLVTVPAVLCPVAATFRPAVGPYLMHFVLIATLVAALSVLAAINIGRGANPWFPYEALYVAVMYIYFVSGLTFYQAIFCALTLSAAFVATNWSLREHAALLYETYFLLLANGVGIIAHYLIERQARTSFLLRHELEQQAILDPLTGLMNRRAFTARLDMIWRQARRNLTSVGLILIDLDGFKKINDSRGHQFGDEVLIHVAEVLKACALRPLDVAARYGGDEFIAAWYDVDGAWFAKLAEDLPSKIAGLENVTVSGGAILAWPRPDLEPGVAIKAADELLYNKKRNDPGHIGHVVLSKTADAKAA